jgi:hypothetical protein
MATRVVTVNDILGGHVGLDLECFDRIYLNGWVPNLQVSGQVVNFLTHHLGFPIPSPAILERIGLRFRKAVAEFAAANDIAVIRFAKGERKLDVMRPHLDRLARQGRCGVAAIGVAQEFQRVFTGTTYHPDADGGGVPRFGFHKADRRVTAYYFYLVDEVFGPAFIKVCAYFPYPVKIWLNGHEFAKRAATAAGIGFTELDNGFATTDDPAGLQQLCGGGAWPGSPRPRSGGSPSCSCCRSCCSRPRSLPACTPSRPSRSLLLAYLATALYEESLWRGAILGLLRPTGVWRAVLLSSLLFGLGHLANSALRGLSLLILAQAFGAAVQGFGLAALRLRTNTVWPLIPLHALHDVFLQLGNLPIPVIQVPIDTIFLIYGIVLLRWRPAAAIDPDPARAR